MSMRPQDCKTQQMQDDEEKIRSLQEQLLSSELLYSRLLNELHSVNMSLRQENARLQKKNTHLRDRISRKESEIYDLQSEVERLKVGRVALSQVFQSLLRRLRIDRLINSISNSAPKDLSRMKLLNDTAPGIEPSKPKIGSLVDEYQAKPSSIIQESLSSTLVEALAIVQTISPESSLDCVEEIVSFFKSILLDRSSVLCISPSANSLILSLAQAFACQGLDVLCIDVESELVQSLEPAGVKVLKERFGSYLANLNPSDLSGFDVICVDSRLASYELSLIHFKVSPSSKLIFEHSTNGKCLCDFGLAVSDFKTKSNDVLKLGGLYLYPTPPAVFLNPLHTASQVRLGQQWPWNYPALKASDKMPSGNPWPKISIVTVTRNQGEYLEETIRSVLMQGYPNLEYIVIDGCSTDNTIEVLDRYRKELTVCISEPDNGQSHALNKGFNKATGEIFAWLNSDDCYLPFTLFRVALAFDLYKTDLVVGGCQLRKGFTLPAFKTHHSTFRYGEIVHLPLDRLLDIDNCWQKGEFFYQPEVFWTRDIWNRSGSRVREDLFYSMDYELWVRMAREGAKLVHIPDALALYRVHEQQKTFGDEPPFLQELQAVAAELQENG